MLLVLTAQAIMASTRWHTEYVTFCFVITFLILQQSFISMHVLKAYECQFCFIISLELSKFCSFEPHKWGYISLVNLYSDFWPTRPKLQRRPVFSHICLENKIPYTLQLVQLWSPLQYLFDTLVKFIIFGKFTCVEILLGQLLDWEDFLRVPLFSLFSWVILNFDYILNHLEHVILH